MSNPTVLQSTPPGARPWSPGIGTRSTVAFSAALAFAFALALGLALVLAAVPSTAQAQTTCNPATASCIPGSVPGGSGGSCTPLNQSIGLCTPGGGSSGGGGSGSIGGGGIGGAVGGSCQAPPGGNPSCGGGPAVVSSTGPSSGAGNPINLLSGNKFQEETDLPALPGVLGLELRRYYNSQSSHPGLLGANWRMSYESVLYDFGSEIQIVQADGRRLMFQRGMGENAALCSTPQPADGQVRIEAAADGRGPPTYHWRWADGRTLSFGAGSGGGHPLQAITAATGERLTLSYSPSGELTTVRDPQGRRLDFIYASKAEVVSQKRSRALKAVDTPLGRLSYRQDALGRLTEVGQAVDATTPAHLTRLYRYEARYNAGYSPGLTGISVRGVDPQTHQPVEQRVSTYAYNAAGQAVLSTKGRPQQEKEDKDKGGKSAQDPDTGIEQVEITYLTKALPRPVAVDVKTGEVTPKPADLGRAILTNSLGQKTEVTSAVIGGNYRLIEMRGPGCSTCGPGDMRYAYDARGSLLRATKLDGQGRIVKSEITERDRYGRTARVGVQSYDGGRAESKPESKAGKTRWTERFEYADVTYPDGSVAVAAQPSLIARPSVVEGKEHTVAVTYNAAGQPTQLVESGFSPVDDHGAPTPQGSPITRTTRFAYQRIDQRSLLVAIDGPLPNGPKGTPDDSDITRFEWSRNGDFVTATTSPANQRTTTDRDDAGRIAQVISTESGSRIQSQADYASALQLAPNAIKQRWWLADRAGQPLGDPLVRQVEFMPGTQTSPDNHIDINAQDNDPSRTTTLADSTPSEFLQVSRGALGTAAQGHVTGLQSRTAAAHRRFDDFARVVAIENPGQSVQTAVYDPADRLTQVIDPRGARQVMTWNAAGRLLTLQRFMPGASVAQQSLHWKYAGSWVVEETITDADGSRSTHTERDARGRVVREDQRIEPAEGLRSAIPEAITLTQSFRHDEQGRIAESELTDNHSAHSSSTPNAVSP